MYHTYMYLLPLCFCSSPEWNLVSQKQRDKLRMAIADDGEFWMPWSVFWGFFSKITVCSMSPDYDNDGKPDGLSKYCQQCVIPLKHYLTKFIFQGGFPALICHKTEIF